MIENIIQTNQGYRATIDGAEWSIPNDARNRHSQMVQDAIASGATVTVEEALPPAIPQEVSRFQAKEALRQAGLLDQADAAVAASGNATLQNAWANANTFKRTSPGINALAPAIGLDDAGLDALFTAAAGIVA